MPFCEKFTQMIPLWMTMGAMVTLSGGLLAAEMTSKLRK